MTPEHLHKLNLELHRLIGRLQERMELKDHVAMKDEVDMAQVLALTLISAHLGKLREGMTLWHRSDY